MDDEPDTVYGPRIITEAYAYARLRLSQRSMAARWGIRETTINEWKNIHPEFREALEKGRADLELGLTQVVITDALGRKDRRLNGKGEMVEIEIESPNPDRAHAILKTVNRDEWGEVQKIEFDNITKMSDAELDAQIAEYQARLNGDNTGQASPLALTDGEKSAGESGEGQ